MEILAVIPARGGSKGIPRKNIKNLAGEPLIAFAIKAALDSEFITRLVVSTDDEEIGKIAEKYGAEVIWRPKEISGDEASSESALIHALSNLSIEESYHPDLLVFLQCTSPLTIAEDIDGTIKALIENDADTSLAVSPFHYFLWKESDHGAESINHDKSVRLRRQDREPQYVETGAVYVMKAKQFLQTKRRFFGKTVLNIIPSERRLEIDEPVDFLIAENMLNLVKINKRLEMIPEKPSAIIFDFDGVFTDNRVLVSENGLEAVFCSRLDGHGLSLLKKKGIPVLVLSTERNPIVSVRTKKLGLVTIHGVAGDKRKVLEKWFFENGYDPAYAIYTGNDVNDLSCMQYVGCSVAVNDAVFEVKQQARLVLSKNGGEGAVRELCDLILRRLE